MSNNDNVFQPNPAQKDFLDQLHTTYFVLINNLTGLHPSEISMEDKATDLFEKPELYGHVLVKMHLYNNLQPDYAPYTEFEKFPTLGDAFDHIAGLAMIQEGLLSEEEL